MDFSFTDEQQELKREARRWLTERYPLDRDWENESDAWAELAELGWLGVSVAEEEGGAGLGFVEEAILLEELGYALYPGPYLATVGLALPLLGPEQRARVAAGEERWSVEMHGLVPWLGSVDFVDADGAALRRRAARSCRRSTRRGRSGRLERGDGTPLPGARNLPRSRAADACEAVGVAQRALELGVEHARPASSSASRSASTRPSRTRSPTRTPTSSSPGRSPTGPPGASPRATRRRRQRPPRRRRSPTEAAVTACERSIQVHGGTGFTWEHPLHRYYKRALWLHGFGASPAELRAEVAEPCSAPQYGLSGTGQPSRTRDVFAS